MDSIIGMTAEIVMFFYQTTYDILLTVFLIAFIMKIITITVTHKDVYDTQISTHIKPIQISIISKKKNDENKNTAQVLAMYKVYEYSTLSGAFSLITQTIVVVLLTVLFINNEKYLPELPNIYLIFKDIFSNIIYTHDMSSIALTLTLTVSIFAIYYALSDYSTEKLVVDTTFASKIIMIVICLISILVPFIVSFYILCSLFLYVVQYAITVKFIPISQKKLDKMDELYKASLGKTTKSKKKKNDDDAKTKKIKK